MVKNLPAKAGDGRDVGLFLGWGRSPGGGHGNHRLSPCKQLERQTNTSNAGEGVEKREPSSTVDGNAN